MSEIEVLISEAELQARLPTLAREIVDALPDAARSEGVTVVGLLKGAVPFVADLSRALHRLGVAVRWEFLTLSSYGDGTESSGTVTLVQDMVGDVAGQHVLLIDDIIDTGRTLAFAHAHLLARGPASLRVVAMLDKPSRRVADLPVDHVGFEVPNVFVLGYGGDHAQAWRELPFIGVQR